VLVALAPAPGRAEDEIPPDRKAVILVRALAYDNNLKARAGSSVVVAVLSRGEAAAEGMYRAFKALESVRVQDLPLRVVKLQYAGKEALHAAIGAQGIDALYCTPGVESDLAAVRAVSRQDHVITLGAREEAVRGGLSMGVFLVGGKMTITVNLPASREEGAALSSELLRLAQVIR
jgi:hypothetical protein